MSFLGLAFLVHCRRWFLCVWISLQFLHVIFLWLEVTSGRKRGVLWRKPTGSPIEQNLSDHTFTYCREQKLLSLQFFACRAFVDACYSIAYCVSIVFLERGLLRKTRGEKECAWLRQVSVAREHMSQFHTRLIKGLFIKKWIACFYVLSLDLRACVCVFYWCLCF